MSQIGMLLGTIVYVNAGSQLAMVDTPSGIMSPSVILSLALLGVSPIIAKYLLGVINRVRE
tara:strand:- start:194 stop:376 length:183 start_codon:yes stop_codon:yes gene_type:complete